MDKRVRTPAWSKSVQKKLIDKELTKKDLARALKLNYTQMIGVLSGKTINPTIQERICAFMNVK